MNKTAATIRVRARATHFASILALAALATACLSSGRADRDRVPLHVAVVPVAVTAVVPPPPIEAAVASDTNDDAGAAEEVADVRVSIDDAEFTNELAIALERAGFSRATVLEPPSDLSPTEFGGWDSNRRDAYWIQQSEDIGADVVLHGELRFVPDATSHTNEKYWLNVPLFLIGGPLGFFVADRTYEVDARVTAHLHERNALTLDQRGLDGRQSEVMRLTTRFEGADLDLVDRAGADAKTLLLSLILPAGGLAKTGPRVDRRLSEHLTTDLADGLAEELYRGRANMIEADRIAAFYLDPSIAIEHTEAGLVVRGEAVVHRSEAERMHEFVIRIGDASVVGTFDEEREDPSESTQRNRLIRFPFEATLPAGSTSTELRIELLGGGRQLAVRTYTCRVPDRS